MTLTQTSRYVGLLATPLRRACGVKVFALGTLAATTGCGAESDAGTGPYAFLASPAPLPEPVGAVSATDLRRTLDPQDGDRCERGRALAEDGSCVVVPTKELSHTQLVLIPGGDAIIGYIPSVFDASPARKSPMILWSGMPPRRQEVASFWIDVIEVTRGAYQECVDAGACSAAVCPPGSALDDARNTAPIPDELVSTLPQTCVTFSQAEHYCQFRGERLPREAEWELAARGPLGARYPWGEDLIDELPLGLLPTEWSRAEPSYYGALAMAVSAAEWVDEVYDGDAALLPFLKGPFRLADGPYLLRLRQRSVELGYEAMGDRRVIKGGEAGRRFAGRSREAGDVRLEEVAPNLFSDRDPQVGFRCAMDRGADDPELRVSLPAPSVPLTRVFGELEMFGGAAEGVNLQEAQNFCANLEIPDAAARESAWRLPTLEEIIALGPAFRGPGPFHTQDGPVISTKSTPATETSPGVAIWEPAPNTSELDPLAARCVRDL